MDDEDAIGVASTLMEDQTLNGLASSVYVEGNTGYVQYLDPGQDGAAFLGCEWRVRVLRLPREPLVRRPGARPLRADPDLPRQLRRTCDALRRHRGDRGRGRRRREPGHGAASSASRPSSGTTVPRPQVQRRHPARARPGRQSPAGGLRRADRLRRLDRPPDPARATASRRGARLPAGRLRLRGRARADRDPARLRGRRRDPRLPAAAARALRLPPRGRRPQARLRHLDPLQRPPRTTGSARAGLPGPLRRPAPAADRGLEVTRRAAQPLRRRRRAPRPAAATRSSCWHGIYPAEALERDGRPLPACPHDRRPVQGRRAPGAIVGTGPATCSRQNSIPGPRLAPSDAATSF